MTELDGPRAAPTDGGKPEQLVVLLHGYGANGDDLFGLVPLLAPLLPNAAFVAPNAPEPCELNPFGFQWFSLEDRAPGAMETGVRRAQGLLDSFIDRELEAQGLRAADLAVIGFSQGTMVALHSLLRRPEAVACLIGFSGRLVAPETLPAEIKSKPPILLVHGEEDQVVPFDELAAAKAGLEAAGITPKTLARPDLGHGIDPEGLEAAAAFLLEALGSASEDSAGVSGG